jgi:hypothetical protein
MKRKTLDVIIKIGIEVAERLSIILKEKNKRRRKSIKKRTSQLLTKD